MAVEPERIHVLLARRGFGSRREVESWIRSGHLQVNGKPARLGQKINPSEDKVNYKGKRLSLTGDPKKLVIALHKPRGVLSTVKDPEGRPTVSDLVPADFRLFPVGRLDFNSEGLILMTNDGDLAQHITHPKYGVPKIYEVKIRGNMDDKKIEYLRKGVVKDTVKFKGAEVLNVRDATREGVKKYVVHIKVFEGKNHEVRNIFDAIRCRVIRLKRTDVSSVSIKGIPRGKFRVLSHREVEALRRAVHL